jgi:hypothetical protein
MNVSACNKAVVSVPDKFFMGVGLFTGIGFFCNGFSEFIKAHGVF